MRILVKKFHCMVERHLKEKNLTGKQLQELHKMNGKIGFKKATLDNRHKVVDGK